MQVHLVEEPHEYYDDYGRLWPGVTTVMAAAGLCQDFSRVRFGTMARRQKEGKLVHRACELLDGPGLDWNKLHETLFPYVFAWAEWCEKTGFVVHQNEATAWNEDLFFAGTLDRTGWLPGHGYIVLDIKTGEIHPSVGVQLAAYDLCLPKLNKGQGVRERLALRLTKNGLAHEKWFKDADDRRVFLSAITCYNYASRYKTRKAA